jgi:hypothetical protein
MTLRRLFVVVAVMEACYGVAGLLLPPSWVQGLLGWNLSPDGHWVAKLLGAALLAQALTAWVLREGPPRAVAVVLGAYQLVAVAVDVGVLLFLDGALVHPVARAGAFLAIVTHGLVGILLLAAAAKSDS